MLNQTGQGSSGQVDNYNFENFFSHSSNEEAEQQKIHDAVLPAFEKEEPRKRVHAPAAEPVDIVTEIPAPPPMILQEPSEEMLEKANVEAQRIIDQTLQEAESLKEGALRQGYQNGYNKGFDEGLIAGVRQAYEEHKEEMRYERQAFLIDVKAAMEKIDSQKQEIFESYKEDLKNLAISVAEKIINVSLKSSGKIIEKMIVSATEEIKGKQWARIYVSKEDADLMMEGDMNILEAVKSSSDHVRIIVRENEPQGTCIIEFPDQIIDASVKVQIENTKALLESEA